ncbi:MAG: PEGA domain-containing protein, partial [Deltaproteobacteria bacterium]|nr:PEGA domain-containing protein [Deltaproteobacteria bacterium]
PPAPLDLALPEELPPTPPAPPAIPLAARRTMIAAVAPPPSALAAAHASPPPSASPGDRVTLTDPTPTPARTPLPMSPSTEARERARRAAGPSPFAEERAPGSPLQLPANPLAALPDEALGYFVECTLYEHTDLAELDGTWATVDAAPRVPIAASAPAIAPGVAIVPTPTSTSRRALFAVATLSVTLGIGGGWLLFGRGSTSEAREDDRAIATAPAASTPRVKTTPASPAASIAAKPATAPKPAAPAPAIAAKPTAPPAAPAPSAPPTPATPTAATPPTPTTPPPAPPAPAIAAATVPPPAPDRPPPTGTCTIAVTTRPAGVTATWSGAALGVTPLAAASVPCGPGELVLTHPRYERVARTLTAGADAAPVEVTMARPVAALTLRSIPAGATFTVNGATVGRGPTTAKVPAFETIRLTAQLPGYAPWHGTVKVRGATSTAFARLTRAR